MRNSATAFSSSAASFRTFIEQALREDQVGRDITSRSVLTPSARCRARLVANERGILAGGRAAVRVFQAVDPSLRCILRLHDGSPLSRGQVILRVEGRARSILAAERTALNLLGHLSGIATLTRAFVDRARPSRATILDTRKTLPGLRALQKYAVRIGGGQNHRAGLHDALLIKTSHLRVLGQAGRHRARHSVAALMAATPGAGRWESVIRGAVMQAQRKHPTRFVEVEVRNLSEFRAALTAAPDAILLDNWKVRDIRKAVALTSPRSRVPGARPLLEASGNVTLKNVRAIAATGVHRISIGRLTHSAPSLDVSLQVI